MLAIAILAAGESRRMGTPKALLDYHGKTFLEHLIDATRHPRVGILRVVLGAKAEEIRAQLRSLDAASIAVNVDWQRGQISSIQAAIRSLPTGATEGLMLCPVDHPMISPAVVSELIAAFDATRKSIVLPVHEGRRGHPVIFRAGLYEELLKASPEVGARQVVWAHAGDVAEVPTEDKGVTLNIDDPSAYRNAFGKNAME
ncbi:MAG TPA: nucleotidyltransferase family protein [Candidatus Acidoferrales bacterium]